MERLTKRTDDGKVAYALLGHGECVDVIDLLRVWGGRLAAYEDTGLEPEEVKEHEAAYIEIMTRTYGPFRQKIGQWLQAEKDGRLVVLPCKKGDTLWSYYDYPTRGISRIVVTAVSTLDGITVINTDNYGELSSKDIGDTVFLTREEAEAALGKGEEG